MCYWKLFVVISFKHLCPHILVADHFTSLQVTEQVMDEKIGRTVTRVVLPRVVMHSRHHYAVFLLEHLLYNSSVIFFHFHIDHVLRQKPTNDCSMVKWQAFSGNFTGLELEDGGGRGTSGFYFLSFSLLF